MWHFPSLGLTFRPELLSAFLYFYPTEITSGTTALHIVRHDPGQLGPIFKKLYLAPVVQHLRADPTIHHVLDGGCGDGTFAAALAEHGFSVFGIDHSSQVIAQAQAKWRAICFAQGSVCEALLPLFPNVHAFDAIISMELVEHLTEPRSFMKHAHEALRPGGLLILSTPYWGYLKSVLLAVTNRLDNSLAALTENGNIKFWSYKTLRALGEEQGFEFVAFQGTGRGLPFLWKGMVMVFRRSHIS